MKILLENNHVLDESVLFEQNMNNYATLFNKINIYSKRGYMASLNESNSRHFRSKFGYNPDILFSVEEKESARDLFCQIRAHLVEQLNQELADVQAQMIYEGVWDNIKSGVKKGVDAVKGKLDAISEKYKKGIEFINKIIKDGVNSVKDFISKIGKLFSTLGENLAEVVEKLGGGTKDESAEDDSVSLNINKAYLEVVPENQRTVFGHVVEYIVEMFKNDKDKAKQLINEGFVDAVAKNKVLQFIIGHREGKQWGWWHTILVSIVGSFIVSVVLPMALCLFGIGGSAAAVICTTVACVWCGRGLFKVLLNRYLNKAPKERFLDKWTVLGIFLSVVPVVVFRIPAVQDFMHDCIKGLFESLGLDKAIDKIEDFLTSIYKHFAGKDVVEVDTKKSGEWIRERVESIANSGDTHTSLMSSGGAHAYIDSLFNGKSDLNTFSGKVSELKTWLETVADAKWTSSTQMLNHLPTLSSDAPLTTVLDGNTFQHVSREALSNAIKELSGQMGIHCELINASNDALRDATHNMAGTSFVLVADANPTSENAAMLNDLIRKTAEKLGVHNVTTFGKIMNNIADFKDVFHETVINNTTVHTLLDTIASCFTPVFCPFFDEKKWGDYKLRLGSNASGYAAYTVTKVEHMKFDKVVELDPDNKAIPLLVKHCDDVLKQQRDMLVNSYKDENKKTGGKISNAVKKFFKIETKKYNENTNIEKHDMVVIYVSGTVKYKSKDGEKKEKELKDVPAVALDMNTMMCVDIAPWFAKRRKVPYFMKGLFSRLDFMPVKKDDNETKEFIHNMLEKTMETACKFCVTYGVGGYYVNYSKDDKKYVPVDEGNANTNFFDIGNLTVNELCNVINEVDNAAYDLLDGKYGQRVIMKSGKDGKITKKTSNNKNLIEKKRYSKKDGKFVEDKNGEYDYIDAVVVPYISRKNSEVYKELAADEDVAELILTKDGDIDTSIIDDEVLNLKQFLYRPGKTFGKEDKVNLVNSINKYLKGRNRKEKLDAYNVVKRMIEIIWRNMSETIRKNRAKRVKES